MFSLGNYSTFFSSTSLINEINQEKHVNVLIIQKGIAKDNFDNGDDNDVEGE